MVEREVTDILIATISTLLLFTFVDISLNKLLGNLLKIALFGIIVLNFLHLIFRQLNRLSDKGSQLYVYINFFLLLTSYVLFLIINPTSIEGFWDNIFSSNGFRIFCHGSYFLAGLLIFISQDADLIT